MRTPTIDELPLGKLRARARTATDLLSAARRHLASVDGFVVLDAALDTTERLLPGLLRPVRHAPEHVAAIARLRHADRIALRDVLTQGGDFPSPPSPGLDDVSAEQIVDAIDRVEILEAVQAHLMTTLGDLERACAA
jgi:hypothetical protein